MLEIIIVSVLASIAWVFGRHRLMDLFLKNKSESLSKEIDEKEKRRNEVKKAYEELDLLKKNKLSEAKAKTVENVIDFYTKRKK